MRADFVDRLEYDEAAPDVEAIMGQIRRFLGEHRAVGTGPAVLGARSGLFNAEVYDELRRAQQDLSGLQIAPFVTRSSIPVFGGFAQMVRLAFHRLVIYYVNRLADAQTRFNTRTVRVLTGLVEGLDRNDATEQIAHLEAQVKGLEMRLRALETAAVEHTASESERG